MITIDIRFQLKSSSEELRKWRLDGKCGSQHALHDGSPAECSREGESPCCSERQQVCGNTPNHCACDSCIDYRLMRPSGSGCAITEVGGFLKRACFGFGSTQIFQCLHSKTRYLRFLETWDGITGRYSLSHVSSICEGDDKAYQACGFNTRITADSEALCGGSLIAVGANGTGGDYVPNVDTEQLPAQDMTVSDESEQSCNGKCDKSTTCIDESLCNGYQYGLRCDMDGEHYIPVHWICNRQHGCHKGEDEKDCDTRDDSSSYRLTCIHFYEKLISGESIEVPILNFTRCAIFIRTVMTFLIKQIVRTKRGSAVTAK